MFGGNSEGVSSLASPTCSVIITTFNRAHILSRSIASVLSCGLSSFELIVVDDGSSDDTAHVVSGFGASVRYVWRANGGASAARNTGILESKGDFIAFLDDDDEFIPGAHVRMVDVLSAESGIGLVFADATVNDCQSEFRRGHRGRVAEALRAMRLRTITPSIYELRTLEFLKFQLLSQNCVLPQTSIIRRQVALDAGGFDESLTGYEEWEFYTRIAALTGTAYMDLPCTRVVKHETNMSRALEVMVQNAVKIREKFRNGPYGINMQVRRELDRMWMDTALDWATFALRRGDIREGRLRLRVFENAGGSRLVSTKYLIVYQLRSWMPVRIGNMLRKIRG